MKRNDENQRFFLVSPLQQKLPKRKNGITAIAKLDSPKNCLSRKFIFEEQTKSDKINFLNR
jgi:hypothetical protein